LLFKLLAVAITQNSHCQKSRRCKDHNYRTNSIVMQKWDRDDWNALKNYGSYNNCFFSGSFFG